MKQLFTLLFSTLWLCGHLSAQYYTNQNKVWTFGNKGGLNFTSGIPVPFTSAFNSLEGAASVSDASGNLLFYSDGKTVWTKIGTVMPSGASVVPYITYSSTQAALIVPVLNNPNQYYLFSLEDNVGGSSNYCNLSYSIIDMTLNGGLGDVLAFSAGTPLDNLLGEQMIAIPGNSCNIWLLVHKRLTADFLAYEITASGINPVPVISNTGATGYEIGTLKVSHDRQKLAHANYALSGFRTELLDFDANTGSVSNYILLDTHPAYSVEFSPDNSKLYECTQNTISQSSLYQYDISLPTPAAIIASAYMVGNFPYRIGDIKLAYDGRIYCPTTTSANINCIVNPNLAGSACQYLPNAISISPNITAIGMPNLYWAAAASVPQTAILCQGQAVTLPASPSGGTWASSNNAVATVSPTGVVTSVATGTAIISYSAPGCGGSVATTTVTVNPAIAPISGSPYLCTSNTTTLSSSPAGGTWTSSNTSVATINPVTHIVGPASVGTTVITYSFGTGCFVTASVTVYPVPTIISGTSSMCIGSTQTLSNSTSGGTWSSNNTSLATVVTSGPGAGTVTAVNAGSATIFYHMPGGCFRAFPITITGAISGSSTTVCPGSTITLFGSPSGGTWSSGNVSAATVSGTGIVTGVAAGTAIISYFSSCGISTTTITVGSPAAITGNTSVCAGSATTLSNAIPGGTWSSTNPAIATISISGVVTGVSAGNVIISYNLGSCSQSTTLTVTAAPLPIVGNTAICQGAATTLSNATPGGTWTSNNTNIAVITAGTGMVSGISPGNAVITYSMGSSCVRIHTITVTVASTTITGSNTICSGNTITLSNATPGGTWTSSNTSVATVMPSGGSTAIVSGIATGNTVITYTAGLCATTVTSITVTAAPAAITGAANICAGATLYLSDATPGGTWTSNNPAAAIVDPSGIVTGVTTGSATITYTATGGCFRTAAITITSPPAAITGPSAVCLGATITLSDTPPGGVWSSANTAIATVSSGAGVLTGITPGAVVITYSLGAGCSSTTTVTVSPVNYIAAGSTGMCTGTTITLSNNITGGIWNSNSTSVASVIPGSSSVTAILSGTAVITYTLPSCTAYTTTISVNPSPAAIIGTRGTCVSSSTTLTSSPVGGIWTNSNPAVAAITASGSNVIVSGSNAGTTIITYTLPGGCFTTATINVTAVVPAITGAMQVCVFQSIILNNTSPGGAWSSGSTAIAAVNPASGVVTGISAGNAVITYSFGAGCFSTATVTVLAAPDPGTITGPSALCIGSSATLNNTAGGGAWSGSTSIATVSSTGVVTALSPGTITITYTVSNTQCISAATKTITVYPLADAGTITGPVSVCAGTTIMLSDSVPGGLWSTGSTAIASVSPAGIVTGIAPGTSVIRYIVSNPACADTASTTITVLETPAAATIIGPANVCPGASFSLTATAPGGLWSSSTPATATVNPATGSVQPLNTGTTTVTYTITSAAGCIATATFILTVTDQATFTINSAITQPQCYGYPGSISILISGGTPPFDYLWSTGSTTATITDLTPGAYTVRIKEQTTQCGKTDSFNIIMPGTLTATPAITDDNCGSGIGSISIEVTGGTTPYSYTWSGSATGNQVTALHAGIYSVSVTDANSCAEHITVVLKDTCSTVTVHNVITPNGDGFNDTWIIEGISLYPANSVKVFDKWGDAVYEKTNYTNDWSGTGKSGKLPDGTYYYLIKLEATNTQTENIFTGSLLIKR